MIGSPLIRRVLSFSSVAAILLLTAPNSLAGRNVRPSDQTVSGVLKAYTPPKNSRRPRRSHTGGSVRGCGDDIVAIAPRFNSVGQTTSTNPTFVWYNFSPDNDPVEFQLYRLRPDDSAEVITIKQFETSQQGYMTYTLAATEANLDVGETYMWQIVIYCDTDFENPGHYSSAELDVVDVPAEVVGVIADNPTRRSEIYAEAGLWYDAIAEVANAESATIQASRQALLQDLADLEGKSNENDATEFSIQLREISNIK